MYNETKTSSIFSSVRINVLRRGFVVCKSIGLSPSKAWLASDRGAMGKELIEVVHLNPNRK